MVMISIDEINKLKAQNKGLIEQNRQLQQVCKTLEEGLNKRQEMLQEIKEYINVQGIDNKWNMRIQRFRSEILQKITKAEEE